MNSEHAPFTDAMLEHLMQEPRLGERPLTGTERWLIADLREARRLLRAVEWAGQTHEEPACPVCGALEHDIRPAFAEVRCHAEGCDLGCYLAAAHGKEQP